MFLHTSTKDAPWISVDSNDGPLARTHVIRHLLTALDYPEKKSSFLRYSSRIIRKV